VAEAAKVGEQPADIQHRVHDELAMGVLTAWASTPTRDRRDEYQVERARLRPASSAAIDRRRPVLLLVPAEMWGYPPPDHLAGRKINDGMGGYVADAAISI
jgi:hypothetical protein